MEKNDVKNIIKQELEGFIKKKDIKKMIDDSISKEIEKIKEQIITQDDIKKMIRKSIVNQYKVLWEKSSFYINKI